jgi:MoaA/NifB/PqqE/SkfB family radical SAM enzyme
MCCESANSKLNDKLDTALIIKTIESIRDIKSITTLGLTGGEPFIYVDDVLSIAEACKKVNRKLSISTNALWCESYDYTYEIVSQLKKNNLVTFLISTDAFHAEFIPVERVKTLLRVCQKLNIVGQIQTVSTKSTMAATDDLIKSLGPDKLNTLVIYGASNMVGQAKNNIDPDDFFIGDHKTVCLYQNNLLIKCDGQAVPCCSPTCFGIPFDFGNIHKDTIQDIIKNMYENSFLRKIVHEGFADILNTAKNELGYIERDGYVNVCHLCHDLLSDGERYAYMLNKAKSLDKIMNGIRNWAK